MRLHGSSIAPEMGTKDCRFNFKEEKKDEERKEPEEACSAKEDEPKYQNVPSSGSSHILYADCIDLLFDSLVRNRHGQANR
jgi:hypothetical protein